MPDPRIISYTADGISERPSLQHLAMLHVDRLTDKGVPTADVVMPFYGATAFEARDRAERWLVEQREAAVARRAAIEAAAAKRAEARKERAA